jgi:hypothetical protein
MWKTAMTCLRARRSQSQQGDPRLHEPGSRAGVKKYLKQFLVCKNLQLPLSCTAYILFPPISLDMFGVWRQSILLYFLYRHRVQYRSVRLCRVLLHSVRIDSLVWLSQFRMSLSKFAMIICGVALFACTTKCIATMTNYPTKLSFLPIFFLMNRSMTL